MRFTHSAASRQQFRFLQRQFLQDGDLPFTSVLTKDCLAQALDSIKIVWKDRIYTPLVTLWVFLGQILSAAHSCRAAVARLIAHRCSQGRTPCSPKTGAYCQARTRLPEKFFSDVARHTGQTQDNHSDSGWLWKQRRVYIFDGTTVTMPDTEENQREYPQNVVQEPGLGFPIARIGAIFSLACGAIVDLRICRYAGKGQGELSVFRSLWNLFQPTDIVLTDCLYCTWTDLLLLKQRGVDSVTQLHINRTADFRKGIRLGKDDHIVRWRKPSSSRSVDWKTYKSLPAYLTVRECRANAQQPGFRPRHIIVVTTLLDVEKYPKGDLAQLYRARWNAELDLRSLKVDLQMDILRCKTPELVRKEIWTHILAYNLIRTIMAQSATHRQFEPRRISFKGAKQIREAFQSVIALQCDARQRENLYGHLLTAIGCHRAGNRPGRFEPRKRKRREKRYDGLFKPRREAKLDLLKRFTKNQVPFVCWTAGGNGRCAAGHRKQIWVSLRWLHLLILSRLTTDQNRIVLRLEEPDLT